MQGSHRFWKSGKSGKIGRHFSSQGKVREFAIFFKNQGKIREFWWPSILYFDETIYFHHWLHTNNIKKIALFSTKEWCFFIIICTFLLIHTLGGKQRPFHKNVIYFSKMSGKRSKILEKSGKNQGISSGRKSGNPDVFCSGFLPIQCFLFFSHFVFGESLSFLIGRFNATTLSYQHWTSRVKCVFLLSRVPINHVCVLAK